MKKSDRIEVAEVVVYKTKEYSAFKYIKGNRPLNQRHSFNLLKSILRNNMLSKLPIVVNEKMEVIDGQHRLDYCRNNDEWVYFIIIEGANLTDVQLLNTYSRPWKIEDYINSYVALGNPHYKKLREITTEYQTPSLFTASLLHGGVLKTTTDRSVIGESVKGGDFKIDSLEYAISLLDLISTLREYAEADCYKNRNFMDAIRIMYKSPEFNLDKMLEKIKDSRSVFRVQGNTKGFVRQFEEVYSFKAKSIVSFMSPAQKAQYKNR